MSHVHFTATEEYRKRVIQLGEQPDHVYNFGTPGIDNIVNLKLLSKKEFEESIDFVLGKKNALVTFHPVTLEFATAEDQFRHLLRALSEFEDVNIIFTKPNADTDGRIIIRLIDEYVEKNKDRCISFHSLGQTRYLSALNYVDFVLGNSSSGIIEAPSFKIPTINIGDRQRGRIKAKSVIDCDPSFESIVHAINLALSPEFRLKIKNITNPYGKAGASRQIADLLKRKSLNNIIKKPFYNI
jgi:GDP/UDP-N,N'-diacetylbacillosamine 2-epimerase (hydrolysing)